MSQGSRSGVDLANLQEVKETGGDLRRGLAQYVTPPDISARLHQRLIDYNGTRFSCVIDPQAGHGALLTPFNFYTSLHAIEIDQTANQSGLTRTIVDDCRSVGRVMDELFPDLVFDAGVSNYPFGLPWRPWEWTWNFLQRHTRMGYMIGAANEIQHLQTHPSVWHHEQFEWPNANVTVQVLFYDTKRKATELQELQSSWADLFRISQEEKRGVPEWNVWLNRESVVAGRLGTVSTNLSTRDRVRHKISRDEAKRLLALDGNTPQVLAVERETRNLLDRLVKGGIYRIEPEAREAIVTAIREAERVATPVMPVTDFERVAYLDEEDHVTCLQSWGPFKRGKNYEIKSMSYTFRNEFIRRRPTLNANTGEMETREHECTLSGQDRKIRVLHNDGWIDFMPNPDPNDPEQKDEGLLWNIFARPAVLTVSDRFPEKVSETRNRLEAMEVIGGFRFFPGQLDYLSRSLVKDHALIGAETGTGKSLMAIAAYVVKDAKRCLIVCPKGTSVADGDDLSQWVSEIHRFAPHAQLFEMFSIKDYDRIRVLNKGVLPDGFYVTYYDAFFTNGAFEKFTDRQTDAQLAELVGLDVPADSPLHRSTALVSTVGEEHVGQGIRSIAKPSLSTLIGHHFDMVCLDEAHAIKTMTAQRTEAAIRLPAKYRYAFTATPVPNTAIDIFPIMGWLCVPDWYKGGFANPAFPFRREDLPRFEANFLAKERDWTAEKMIARATGKNRKVERVSPVLSSPARLLKILKPTIAFITKKHCNPDYLPPRIVDVRVPLGRQQAALYHHFTSLGHVTRTIAGTGIDTGLVRGSAQIEWLRAICTDPVHASTQSRGMSPEPPACSLVFTPKVAAILELVGECLSAGEQCVVINARHGITNILHRYLEQAGVPVSRIDSSGRSGNHTEESNLFKRGNTRVMLMGIKCAVGHSFDQCKNLVIGSLEYSAGPFEQAKGRVDRLTSKESRIYCILNRNTIEEVMFDTVAMKDDASKIILRGQRVPRDFIPVDMSEVLVNSIMAWNAAPDTSVPEEMCLSSLPQIIEKLRVTS
jgi:hypothetical protein